LLFYSFENREKQFLVLNIKVKTSKKFDKEKEYLFSVIFENLLRWEYHIEYSDLDGFILKFPNGREIRTPGIFFEKLEKNHGVYNEDLLPQCISILDEDLKSEKPIHVFYGEAKIKKSENLIELAWDIFGCIFFCLCQVDELVSKDVDEHGRFPIEKSYSYQNGFYQYPLVNALVELLFSLSKEFFPKMERSPRKFEVIPTIDLDHPIKYEGMKGQLKRVRDKISGDAERSSGLSGGNSDPYRDRTVRLIQVLNGWGYSPWVFYLLGQSGKNENTILSRERSVRAVFESLGGLDYLEGLHPGYNSMERGRDQIEFEKKLLENISGTQVFSSRQHYLKYQYPSTFQNLSKSGFTQDFSIGFSKISGFRSGICEPYMLFNPLERKIIGILETPMILMDRTFLPGKRDMDFRKIQKEMEKIVHEVQRYQGKLCLLLHNSTFDEPGGREVNELLLEICEKAKKEK
jgi:Family of unknown function (DUF7033)